MTGDDTLKFIPKSKLKNYNKSLLSENYIELVYTVFLSFAVIFGIILFMYNKDNDETINILSEEFAYYLHSTINTGKLFSFAQLIKNTLPIIFLMLISSTSVIGCVFLYLITFVKLAGFGMYTAFLYTQYGISGIKYFFAVFLPGKLIFIIALLILFELCIKISVDIRNKIRLPATEMKRLIIRLTFIIVLIFISLCIDLITMHALLPLTGIMSFI